jgi:hypothetical protein
MCTSRGYMHTVSLSITISLIITVLLQRTQRGPTYRSNLMNGISHFVWYRWSHVPIYNLCNDCSVCAPEGEIVWDDVTLSVSTRGKLKSLLDREPTTFGLPTGLLLYEVKSVRLGDICTVTEIIFSYLSFSSGVFFGSFNASYKHKP